MKSDYKKITNTTKSHIRQIQRAMRENRLVVFVGAGVSASAGIPNWKQLIEVFKEELDIPDYENDYLKIAQLYKNQRKHKEYKERIEEILDAQNNRFNCIHEELLSLKPCHIVTTNYDVLLESAIAKKNERYYTVSRDEDLPYNRGERLLIKMHGDFKADNIVLTENDYLDYSSNFPLIRAYIMSLFASKLVLFIGFSFNDINLKYILRDVRSCLGDKMQPVYLLSNSEMKEYALDYFDSNFVHVVQLGQQEVVGTLTAQHVKCPVKKFDDDRSNTLFNQLFFLNHYSDNNNSVMSIVLNYLMQYADQFTYLGKYIKYIFPRVYWRDVRLEYGELTIPKCYEDSIKSIFSDTDEGIRFRKSNKEDLTKVLLWLNQNGIERINKPEVDINKQIKELFEEEIQTNPLVLFYKFDINALSKSIEELNDAPLTFSKQDLLFPYLLCKVGRYKQAYDTYKRLAPIMMENRKYVLYFLCLYNMRALYGPVLNDAIREGVESWSKINNEINGIDLNEVVKSLPLSEAMQVILTDLTNSKYLTSHLLDAEQFCDKLREQREDADRGGSSFNSNIQHVLSHYDDLIDFHNNNYIFNESFAYTKNTYLKIAEAILQSILTVENGIGATKLPHLYGDLVMLFVFHIQPEELRKLLKRVVDDKKLSIEDSFNEEIKILLNNLYSVKGKYGRCQKTISGNIVGDCIMNILWLSLYTNKKLELPHINELIAEYWFEGSLAMQNNLFNRYFSEYDVNGADAVAIVNQILHNNLAIAERLSHSIANLCRYAQKEGLTVTDLISVRQIESSNHISFIASFCKGANNIVKEEIKTCLRKKVKCLCHLIEAELLSGERIITVELLAQLKGIYATKNVNNLFPEEYVCAVFRDLRNSDRYADLHVAIDECMENSACYKFLLDPLSYKASWVEVPESWLLYVETNVLSQLMTIPEVRHSVRKYCDEHAWDVEFKKKIWDMLCS